VNCDRSAVDRKALHSDLSHTSRRVETLENAVLWQPLRRIVFRQIRGSRGRDAKAKRRVGPIRTLNRGRKGRRPELLHGAERRLDARGPLRTWNVAERFG